MRNPPATRLGCVIIQWCRTQNLGMNEALDLFHQLLDEKPKPSIFLFNQLLTCIVRMKAHNPSTVISLYNKMNGVGGISPSICTFGIYIGCFSRMSRVDLGFSVFGSLLKQGWSGNAIIFNSLMNGLCIQKNVGEAARLLGRMPQLGCLPDVISRSILIKGYCGAGDTSLAVELLQDMAVGVVGCKHDAVTYCTVIDALCKDGDIDTASKLFQEMSVAGIPPNVATYNTFINALCRRGDMNTASKLFEEMISVGIAPDVVS